MHLKSSFHLLFSHSLESDFEIKKLRKSLIDPKTDIPYLAFGGKLWDVYFNLVFNMI